MSLAPLFFWGKVSNSWILNDRGRNCFLGPVTIWSGKQKKKWPNFLMRTFTYLSPFYLFYGGLCQLSGKWPETPGEPTGKRPGYWTDQDSLDKCRLCPYWSFFALYNYLNKNVLAIISFLPWPLYPKVLSVTNKTCILLSHLPNILLSWCNYVNYKPSLTLWNFVYEIWPSG